jgi:hypothetical protein
MTRARCPVGILVFFLVFFLLPMGRRTGGSAPASPKNNGTWFGVTSSVDGMGRAWTRLSRFFKSAETVSLALNSVAEYHGSFAGILGTGIIGGAVIPVVIGRIGDYAGLRSGVAFLYVTFGFVLSVGFWAKPLITNATVSLRKASAEPAAG